MARVAGCRDNGEEFRFVELRYLERFAALIASRVAAHIRETEFKPDWNNYRQGFADGAAEEREACAGVLDEMADDMVREMEPSTAVAYVRSKAAAIRERSANTAPAVT